MKTFICQINPTIGDIAGNFSKVENCLNSKRHLAKDSLFVFPELTLTGYPPNDLLIRSGFVEEQLEYVNLVKKLSLNHNCGIVIGAVTKTSGDGKKPYHNTALTFFNGKEVGRYNKQLLPTYNIFDESRYFEPGASSQNSSVVINGEKFVVLICEDCWNDPIIEEKRLYGVNPIKNALENEFENDKASFVVTINASPSDVGKHECRFEMYNKLAKAYDLEFIYVNQVGGQDSLIFDGHSFSVNKNGFVYSLGFKEDVCFVDSSSVNFPQVTSMPNTNYESLIIEHLKLGLRDYIYKSGFSKVVVGSSGGIDSALVLTLAKEAFGGENVFAVTMPSKYSSSGSVDDSVELCNNLGVKLFTRPIIDDVTLSINEYKKAFGEEPKRLTIENMQARIRGRILMEFSNQTGAIVLSTGNKSEMSVGYATLYGDMASGLNPLGDLYKTEVYAVAKYYNEQKGDFIIPKNIIEKEPSAELWEGQKDSDSLPPYNALDSILKLFIENEFLSNEKKKELWKNIEKLTIEDINKVLLKVDKSEFKRFQASPILRIHARSFGFGRNVPIVQKYISSFKNLI